MKAEDLRIGDYVKVSSDNCMIPKGAVCEVVAIDSERECEDKKGLADLRQIFREKWDFSHGVWCDDIEGIPINNVFLIKNGWNDVAHNIDRDKFEWIVWEHLESCVEVQFYPHTNEYSAFYCGKELCDIAYVHELQNILVSLKENVEIII